MQRSGRVTGVERFFDKDEVIVSKTTPQGIITYANRTFLNISGYAADEVIGKPHNVIRHPDMPRCIFRLLWERLRAGKETFAYIVNLCKPGDHYWVFAHVTPSLDPERRLLGYHSNRRVPDRPVLVGTIIPLYRSLAEVERRAADPKAGLEQAYAALMSMLADKGTTYDHFIFAI